MQNNSIGKVWKLIERRFRDQGFCVKEICGETGMSMSALHEFLSVKCGMTPHLLIETRRLIEALSLMRGDGLREGMIAGGCGFSNIRTFRRAFERRLGMPPTEAMVSLRDSADGDRFQNQCIKRLSETGGGRYVRMEHEEKRV